MGMLSKCHVSRNVSYLPFDCLVRLPLPPVAIRMRPLNNIEGDKRRVWKVIPKYSSVAQTTRDGKPLQERVMGRNFFIVDFQEAGPN